ncbi:MAG: UvrD-helicase domain-containing protein [Ketobacter sp.]|nr:UvrD-helicase domain-containing protein [Ketobacter sp.]
MTMNDHKEREQALDVGESFIVQAPAGSGKTGVLTLRILRLLTIVDNPEEILAITFTKKAAAEMRVRVMEALELASHATPPESAYDQQFYYLGRSVLQRDVERSWGLKQNQSRLRLLTIDSFCNGIVRNRPLGSGLGVQFTVAEDASELYQNASRALLASLDQDDDLGSALRRVLGQLDNQFSKLSSLVSQMLSQRDHWISDVTNIHGNMIQFRLLLEHSLRNLNQDALAAVKEAFNPDFFPELDSLAVFAENQLRLQQIEHSLLTAKASSAQHQKEQLKLLLTAKLEPRSRLDKNGGFPTGDNAAEKKENKLYKERAKALIEQIHRSGSPGLTAIQDFINLPDESLTESQWQLLEDLVLIMRFAAAHLKLEFQSQHRVDFSEIALAALATLGSADDPSDLTLILDNRISHILVDEFQDTSFIQVELLDKLTAGWEQGDGRTLFLVGDPMQSIYAFRKADVGLFIRLWYQQRLGQVPITPLVLSTNFRSSETIISWVNNVFSRVFPSRADTRKGAVTYSQSKANRTAKAEDIVALEFFSHEEKQKACATKDEARWIADTIAKTNASDSIAILAKGKAHVAPIVAELKSAGIAYQAVDIESLAHSQMITDLMSVARAYLSPNDKTAWFALMRGPWCGISLIDLQRVASVAATPWQALQILSNSDQWSVHFEAPVQHKLQHLHGLFVKAYGDRHRYSWQQSLRELVLGLGLPATANNAAELESIDLFFALLDSINTIADTPDFNALQRKLTDFFVPPEVYPEDQRVVQVMTMHKSKGLEFDVVFLPQLNRKPRGDDKPLILLDKQTAIASEEQELFLAPLESRTLQSTGSVYDYLWKLKKQRALNEAARLLYVACTRAKRKLYLSACVENKDGDFKKPETNSLLALLFPIRDVIDSNVHTCTLSELDSPKRPFRTTSNDFINMLARSDHSALHQPVDVSVIGESEQETGQQHRRLAGILTHRLFEQLSNNASLYASLSPERCAHSWRQELIRMGVMESSLEAALDIVTRAIVNVQSSDNGRWLFGKTHTQDQAELSLIYQSEDSSNPLQTVSKNIIIDRTFIENETRFIIDYKLSEPEGDTDAFINQEVAHYRAQLAGYHQALYAMEASPTKLFLYFPLIDHLQEVTL